MRERSSAPRRSSSATASRQRSSIVSAERTPANTRIGSRGSPAGAVPRKRVPSKSSAARGSALPSPPLTLSSQASAGYCSKRTRRGPARVASRCQPANAATPIASAAAAVRGSSSGAERSRTGATAPTSAQMPPTRATVPASATPLTGLAESSASVASGARAGEHRAGRGLAALDPVGEPHHGHLGPRPRHGAQPRGGGRDGELLATAAAQQRRRERDRERERRGQPRGVAALHLGLGLGRLGRQARDGLVERHRPEVALAVAAQRHGALLGLAVADDEHVGHLAQLRLADLAPDRLGAVVELGAQPRRPERLRDLAA